MPVLAREMKSRGLLGLPNLLRHGLTDDYGPIKFPFHCSTRVCRERTCGTRTTMNTARRRLRPSTANLIWTNMAFIQRSNIQRHRRPPRRDERTTNACFVYPRDRMGHYTWREDTVNVLALAASVRGMHASRRTMWSADSRPTVGYIMYDCGQ